MAPYLTPPPVANPRTPTFKPPHGPVDCHMHLFDTRYPRRQTRNTSRPTRCRRPISTSWTASASPWACSSRRRPRHQPGAPRRRAARLSRPLHRRCRARRCLDQEITRLDKAGVRGARFQSAAHWLEAAEASRSRPPRRSTGSAWHAQLYPHGTEIIELEALVAKLPNRVVFDHFASIPMDEAGLDQPAVKTLFRLLDTGRVWVKLSRPDRISKKGKPWDASTTLARALVKHAPERCLVGHRLAACRPGQSADAG